MFKCGDGGLVCLQGNIPTRGPDPPPARRRTRGGLDVAAQEGLDGGLREVKVQHPQNLALHLQHLRRAGR